MIKIRKHIAVAFAVLLAFAALNSAHAAKRHGPQPWKVVTIQPGHVT
jgi:hypothetical protein